jgi:hypothetical protein
MGLEISEKRQKFMIVAREYYNENEYIKIGA